jgi:hypothetical protein
VLGDALRDALDPRHENAVAVEQVSA